MKLILKETIESLGIIGSEVDVAPGYARNYLLPQNKAVAATDANRKQLSQQKAKFDLQITKEKEVAQEMAKKLEEITCTITAKVSDGDQLYGSVTTRDIINALSKQEIKIEKRMILLKEPIKRLGTFKVPIRVYNEVEPEISIEVIAE